MKAAPPDPRGLNEKLWSGMSGFLFDIGANQGQTLRAAAGRFHSILSLEPSRESYVALSATAEEMRHRFESVVTLPIAASDHNGEVTLIAHPDKMESGQLVSHFAAFDELSDADHEQRHIECVTVDSLVGQFGRPDVLKVDVEGHELRVLHGAEETLSSGVAFVVEIHSRELGEQCWSLLESLGRTDFLVVRHPYHEPGAAFYNEHYWLRSTL